MKRTCRGLRALLIPAILFFGSACLLVERPRYGQTCAEDSDCGAPYICSQKVCVPKDFVDGGTANDGGRSDAGRSLDAAVGDIQDYQYVGELSSPSAADGDMFGSALGFGRGQLLVGRSRGGSSSTGDVLVFEQAVNSTWQLAQTLAPGDLPTGGAFGSALAVGGNWLAVGDPTYNGLPGEVHMFEYLGASWTHRGTLSRSDATAGDAFGQSLAISADGATLLVGAPNTTLLLNDAGQALYAGAVSIFQRGTSGWSEVQRFVAPSPNDASGFGSALALSADGNLCVVGASGENVPGAISGGAAYVYRRSGEVWSRDQRLAQTSPLAGDEYGTSVAIVGGIIAIGAPGIDDRRGRVDLFADDGSSLSLASSLYAEQRAADSSFGSQLGTANGVLAVSSRPSASGPALPVHVFVRSSSGWQLHSLLSHEEAQTRDDFGAVIGVAIDGRLIALGLPRKNADAITEVGQVLLYER